MAREKKGKKKWYLLMAPKELNNQVFGETLAYSKEDLVGRKIKINLSNLMSDVKKQNTKLGLRVKEVKDDKALTEVIGYEMLNAYVKRLVRKDVNRIDDSFMGETKDKIKVRVKPFILTRSKTSNNIIKDIRKKTKDIVIDEMKKQDYSNFLKDIISGKSQKTLKDSVNKIYPTSVCGFRKVVVA